MRVHLRITPPDTGEFHLLFDTLDRKLPSFRVLGFSLCVHLSIAWVLAMISFPQPRVLAKSHPLDPTEIRIGDRLYYVARIPPREPAPAQARRVSAPKKAPARKSENPPAPAAQAVAEVKEPAPVPRAFIPPEYKRDPIAEQTLIQPDSAPNIRPKDPDVPSFRIWSAEVPKIPKKFVAPGQRVQPVENPQLLAQPTFDLNRPARQVNLTPHLTLPPPPAPLDLPPAPENPQLTAGDPINILSLSNRPALPDNVLVVPPGAVVAEGKPGSPAAASAPAASSAAATPARPTAQPAGEGSGDAKPSSSANAASASASASVASAAPTPASTSGTGTASNATSPSAVKQTIIIRPSNGNFDTVVVQSSPLDLFPEGRNLLSGRPVYTVYIAVGAAKDWPMYFCVSGEKPQESKANPGVVVLSSPPPVRAPYPTRIVRPEISLPKYEKYVLLHAILNEVGRFRELRVVNAGAPQTDQAIVEAMEAWEFRPASRDGVPVAVEVLLAIPAAGL